MACSARERRIVSSGGCFVASRYSWSWRYFLQPPQEDAHDVHVEDIADLGLDLPRHRPPLEAGQLGHRFLEPSARLALLDRLARVLGAGEEEVPQRQRALSH